MPIFIYKAKKGPKEIIEGNLTADSKEGVIARLTEEGYFPISVEEESKSKKKVATKKIRISAKDVGIFTRQLADLLEGGLTLYQALDTLVKQTESKNFARLILEVRDQIREGNTLSDTLQKYPKVFNALYINMVRSGETGGMLESVLVRLAEFSEKQQELRSKIKSTLVYPLFLCSFGILTVLVLIIFVVPRLTNVFLDFGQDLPLPTKILIGISEFVGTWWWLLLVVIALLVFIVYQQSKSSEGKLIIDKLKLRLPIVGRLILVGELARFSRTLATLLESGVPVLKSLDIVKHTVGNEVIRKEIAIVHTDISKGASLGNTLEKSLYFPVLMTSMIKVGEKGGMIERVLVKVADTYDREIEKVSKMFTVLLEPILILVLGLVVGFVVISMLLPIFNINMAVG